MARWKCVGNHRGASRLLKTLNDRHAESGHVNVPWLNPAGENQQSQARKHQTVDHLCNHDLHLARVTIGGAPRHRRQKESRNGLNSTHQTELQR
jgi:hypothetical protein